MVYAYVCRVIDGRGRYLLLQRTGQVMHGVWQPVTGRVEAGEAGWQTALRETVEETGLRPDRFYSANHVELFYEPRWECIAVAPVFVALMDANNEPQVTLSEEHGAFAWCDVETACERLLFPQQCATIRYIERTFIQSEPVAYLKIET